MRNARLDESQAISQDCQEKYQQLHICRWHHPNGKSEEELKSPLMKVKEESEKAGLKLQHLKNLDRGIWSHHFMAYRWEKMETVTDFIFLGSKITVDVDCSHEIKRHLPWKKSYNQPRQRYNLDNLCIKKQRHHFANKGPESQSYGFSSSHVSMWELDHQDDWGPKN